MRGAGRAERDRQEEQHGSPRRPKLLHLQHSYRQIYTRMTARYRFSENVYANVARKRGWRWRAGSLQSPKEAK